jgi:hypothetical protein
LIPGQLTSWRHRNLHVRGPSARGWRPPAHTATCRWPPPVAFFRSKGKSVPSSIDKLNETPTKAGPEKPTHFEACSW